jgi:hypothetical protein
MAVNRYAAHEFSYHQKGGGVMEHEGDVNIFTPYDKDEDRFTNGLISLLSLSTPEFVKAFFWDLLDHEIVGNVGTFKVQVSDEHGRPDAELSGEGWCIRFETKIVSGDLGEVNDRKNQVHRHLRDLKECPGRLRRLVLLTPDDRQSDYIRTIVSKHKPTVLHLEWKRVYDYLDNSLTGQTERVLSQLVRQFLEQIRDWIFEEDFVGIIQKVAFGEWTGIDPDTLLGELRRGERTYWNTPQKYEKLDGKGRKLLLYDGTRKAINVPLNYWFSCSGVDPG